MTKPKLNKVAGYLRALELMNKQGMSQLEACKVSGLSRMTFNKYREMLGDEVAPNKIEVLPKSVPVIKAPKKSGDLDSLIAENTIMERNLQLKRELGLLN